MCCPLFECHPVQLFSNGTPAVFGSLWQQIPNNLCRHVCSGAFDRYACRKAQSPCAAIRAGCLSDKTPFDMNRQLQKAETLDEVYQMTATQIQKLMQRDVLIYPAQGDVLLDGNVYPADGSSPYCIPDTDQEQNVIQWVWQNRKRAGATTQTFQRQNGCILPFVPSSRFSALSGFRWRSKRSLTHLHPVCCFHSRRVRSGAGKPTQRRRKGKSRRPCKE